jgi:hypothetical protein
MKQTLVAATLTAGLLLSQGALAVDNISYTSLDIGVSRVSADDFDDETLGATLRARIGVTRSWFLAGEATRYSDTFEFVDFDANEFSAGVGYALHPSDTISYYGQASLLRVETTAFVPDLAALKIDDIGQELRVGARYAPSTRFEAEISARKQMLDDNFDDETFVVAGGHYYLNDQLGFGLEGHIGRENQLFSATVRLRF